MIGNNKLTHHLILKRFELSRNKTLMGVAMQQLEFKLFHRLQNLVRLIKLFISMQSYLGPSFPKVLSLSSENMLSN